MAFVKDKPLGKLQAENLEETCEDDKGCNREEGHKNDGFNRKSNQTRKQRNSEPAIASFRRFVNVYNTIKGRDFTDDHENHQDDSHMEYESHNETQVNREGERRRVVWTESELNEGNHPSVGTESADQAEYQDCQSTYLYDRNPLQDPRFTRLVERLVPLRTQLQGERKKLPDYNRKGYAYDKCDEICFKDICLNETCRLVFKIMNQGNGDFQKE